MDLEKVGSFSLFGLSRFNVILGKNGCGKSFLLRDIETALPYKAKNARIRYVSPERGGFLQYDPNIEQTIANNPTWMAEVRRRNQSDSFRRQSATLFRLLELLVLREIEKDHAKPGYIPKTFDTTVGKLNALLDRVRIERDTAKAFKIVDRESGNEASPESISSGEAELISLGIELLAFVRDAQAGVNNFLLVDEPDVHLHPDLQDRLANFIVENLRDTPVILILATHCTSLLAGLAKREDTRVAFMRINDKVLHFQEVSDVHRQVLPVFGAHPLSNVFNQSPILLVEGNDDERVWQQAIRSSKGKVLIYPCAVEGVPGFAEFETQVNNILEAVYDDAKGFSLRDRDDHPELIDDVGRVVRMRLACRAAENLMLSNEALALGGSTWPALKGKIDQWVAVNKTHQYHDDMREFAQNGFDRKGHDLKTIRNILVAMLTNKPWEVVVGQAIAQLSQNGGQIAEGSLRDYLGEKICVEILRLK